MSQNCVCLFFPHLDAIPDSCVPVCQFCFEYEVGFLCCTVRRNGGFNRCVPFFVSAFPQHEDTIYGPLQHVAMVVERESQTEAWVELWSWEEKMKGHEKMKKCFKD